MIHCKKKCPLGKFDGCCRSCPDRSDCLEVCEHDPTQCGDAAWDEETALAVFQKSQLATLNAIASLTAHKKAVEEQEKSMKASLLSAVKQYGITRFESDILNLTYVAPTVSQGIDAAKLKKKYPVAADCVKDSPRAEYIKITLKDGEVDGWDA